MLKSITRPSTGTGNRNVVRGLCAKRDSEQPSIDKLASLFYMDIGHMSINDNPNTNPKQKTWH